MIFKMNFDMLSAKANELQIMMQSGAKYFLHKISEYPDNDVYKKGK
ncbi:MAG: hypothetical protein Q8930_11015 [Bacillota bacterium]|nr:hypothetical protein [Bacillota bacterium]